MIYLINKFIIINKITIFIIKIRNLVYITLLNIDIYKNLLVLV